MEEKLRFVLEYEQGRRTMTSCARDMRSRARPGMCGCGDIGRQVGKDLYSKAERRAGMGTRHPEKIEQMVLVTQGLPKGDPKGRFEEVLLFATKMEKRRGGATGSGHRNPKNLTTD